VSSPLMRPSQGDKGLSWVKRSSSAEPFPAPLEEGAQFALEQKAEQAGIPLEVERTDMAERSASSSDIR
jgi:hypothetical protein